MLFSVIIPVYNAGQFIGACMDSVLSQSYPDWELIVVDDGSTDGSGVTADEYADRDERIRVIHQNNAGQLHARRTGLSFCKGEYVLFLDSDDFWRSDCLATIASAIMEHSPDVIMFCARRIGHTRRESEIIGAGITRQQWLDKDHIYRVLLSGHDYNSLCLKAWKRELFSGDPTDYRVFSGTCWGEDKVQLLYPMTQARTVLFIPEALYCYVDNPSSVVHKLDLDKVPVILANHMFALLYDYMKRWSMDIPEFREAIAVYYMRNYLNAYYGTRKACALPGDRKRFRAYDWDAVVSKEAFRYLGSRKLTIRERIKLVLARYFRI